MATILTETKHYVLCEDCNGKVGSIDHLAGSEMRSAGPWHCEDCGKGWAFKTNGTDVTNMVHAGPSRWVPVTVKLVLPPQDKSIVLTLHAHTHEHPNTPIDEGAVYFYEQHTCPTNWMHDVVEIRIGDDRDPHGLFRFESMERGHADEDPLTGQLLPLPPHEGAN